VKLEAIIHELLGLIRVIPQGSLGVHNEFISKGSSGIVILLMRAHTHGNFKTSSMPAYQTQLLTQYANINNMICFQMGGCTHSCTHVALIFDGFKLLMIY